MNVKTVLATRPRLLRSSISRGLSTTDSSPIDRTGGDFGAGIIRGMAILTRGVAEGHYLWCDKVMLAQACDAINASAKGIKARFTHPDLSGDGLGKGLGRVKNGRLDGDVVRGDLHFTQAAHDTPDGDLAGYVMNLASEDPESFGNSIAFDCDYVAEDKFRAEHSQADADGYPEFRSPDGQNEHNLTHARIKELRAVDTVDDPAANPDGLFHRGQELATDAERLIAFSLGLSAERPALVALDADPDRVRGFIQRFLSRHNLTLSTKDTAMPKTTAQLDAELRTHFGTRPAYRRLSADKDDKKENEAKGAQEEGDADKDEGHEPDKDEKRGDNYSAGKTPARLLTSDEGDADDKELDDDEEKDKEKKDEKLAAAGKQTRLAEGGAAPGGDSSSDAGTVEDEKQKTQKKVADKSKQDAEKGAAVQPEDGKEAIGPMGDASHNVGYSAAVKECQRFAAAFGAQGAVWFAEGKTFAQASALSVKSLAKERDDLKKENEQLRTKLGSKRGLDSPLSGATSQPASTATPKARGAALSQFTAGLAEQLRSGGNLN